MNALTKFHDLLRELFQFDCADLDFGIYRIMNHYAYFEFTKKQARIISLNLETKETKELYRKEAPPDIVKLTVSPDGKKSNLYHGRAEMALVCGGYPRRRKKTLRSHQIENGSGWNVRLDTGWEAHCLF